MANRNTILNTLKNDLNSINQANGYSQDLIEVRVGNYMHTDFSQYPALCFFPTNDVITEETNDGDRQRNLSILIWGFTIEPEDVFLLSEDIEKFLYSTDFTYANQTLLDQEGPSFSINSSVNDRISMFFLKFNINYNQSY